MRDLNIRQIVSFGADAGRGNLVGIQTDMSPTDYATAAAFQAWLDGYLAAAQAQGWLNARTIVVFPEYLGTWLVAADEGPAVTEASQVAVAIRNLILRHPLALARCFLTSRAPDRLRDSVFRLKATIMARAYHDTFSRLAARYAVTIVAGSILLPGARVAEGELHVTDGRLQNITAVYQPDGSPYSEIVRKVYPIADEIPFVAAGKPADLPVFDTPAGRLGVLICADSWYPRPYEVLRDKGAEIIAVPSYLSPTGVWQQPWRGYSGASAPDDVCQEDVGRLTEGEAWLKYALAGRAPAAGFRHGINVFLRGALWDLGADGHTVLVRDGQVIEAAHVDGAALVNSWLT